MGHPCWSEEGRLAGQEPRTWAEVRRRVGEIAGAECCWEADQDAGVSVAFRRAQWWLFGEVGRSQRCWGLYGESLLRLPLPCPHVPSVVSHGGLEMSCPCQMGSPSE